jgi:hypothetical protein
MAISRWSPCEGKWSDFTKPFGIRICSTPSSQRSSGIVRGARETRRRSLRTLTIPINPRARGHGARKSRPDELVIAMSFLREVTVKIHRGHLMRKMKARSLADLVKMAEALRIHHEGVRPGGHT